jgi:hypothetical protein
LQARTQNDSPGFLPVCFLRIRKQNFICLLVNWFVAFSCFVTS